MKLFYLLQASYWLQQTIILAAKIEKPRKDFKELVAHVCLLRSATPLGVLIATAHRYPLPDLLELHGTRESWHLGQRSLLGSR